MLVGEAPGRAEDREGRPFVGRSGRFVDGMLTTVGLTRRQVFVTNSVKCRPPGNRGPRGDELRVCRMNWLDRQVELVNPRVVVLLGMAAIRQTFGATAPLSEMHGQTRTDRSRTYLFAYHPASATRFPMAGKAMAEDIRVLKRLVRTAGRR
jgi:uracil-DNA glycosylase family 4